LSKKKIIS